MTVVWRVSINSHPGMRIAVACAGNIRMESLRQWIEMLWLSYVSVFLFTQLVQKYSGLQKCWRLKDSEVRRLSASKLYLKLLKMTIRSLTFGDLTVLLTVEYCEKPAKSTGGSINFWLWANETTDEEKTSASLLAMSFSLSIPTHCD